MSAEGILIVEDSATQAMRLRNTLEKYGFSVTTARNGREALEMLERARPLAVISDVQMPEMDGYELCRRLKAEPAWRDLPLILLTSLSSPEDIIHGLACGADNFVVKPYDDDFLRARLHGVLANQGLGEAKEGEPIAVQFGGKRYEIAAGRRQMLNLLLSTYEAAMQTNATLLRTHEALKEAQAQLIEAEKAQSVNRLAAGVAHEVRNPLAILEMGSECLAEQPLDEGGRAILEEMREAVRRANRVIGELMDLGSAEGLGRRPTNLHEVIEQALVAVGVAGRAGVLVERDFAPELPPAMVDPAKIAQVFVNVFTNALQAMPKGGTLRISTRAGAAGAATFDPGERAGSRLREGEESIFVEVNDTGSGIAPEHLEKLYDPFFSTKPTGQGMGLGLTVAKKIVEVHRGSIKIASGAGQGTTVTLVFKSAA